MGTYDGDQIIKITLAGPAWKNVLDLSLSLVLSDLKHCNTAVQKKRFVAILDMSQI